MPTYRLDKLTRNHDADGMRADGAEVVSRRLANEELSNALMDKILEELTELRAARLDPHARLNELADLLQLVQSLAAAWSAPLPELEARRAAKAAKRGDFSDGVWIETVTCAPGSRWESYFEATPELTPQVNPKT